MRTLLLGCALAAATAPAGGSTPRFGCTSTIQHEGKGGYWPTLHVDSAGAIHLLYVIGGSADVGAGPSEGSGVRSRLARSRR